MPGSGDSVNPLCLACDWQVDTASDMGGSSQEWTFDASYMDDLTSALASNEAFIDASIYLAVYSDPVQASCVMGIAVGVVEGGAWGSGSSAGNRDIRIRLIPPERRIRIRHIPMP